MIDDIAQLSSFSHNYFGLNTMPYTNTYHMAMYLKYQALLSMYNASHTFAVLSILKTGVLGFIKTGQSGLKSWDDKDFRLAVLYLSIYICEQLRDSTQLF